MVASNMFETIAQNVWGGGGIISPHPAQEHVFSLHNNYVFKLLVVYISNNPAFSTYRYRNSYKINHHYQKILAKLCPTKSEFLPNIKPE